MIHLQKFETNSCPTSNLPILGNIQRKSMHNKLESQKYSDKEDKAKAKKMFFALKWISI